MNIKKLLGVSAVTMALTTVGTAAGNGRFTVEEIPLDEVFDYPCLL